MRQTPMGTTLVTPVEKPLIGFFPDFSSMGETLTLVKIAKTYIAEKGRAIFFSHSPEYEYMAEEIGCPIVHLKKRFNKRHEALEKSYQNGLPFEKMLFRWFDRETIERTVEMEINALKEQKVQLVVSAFNLTSSISARAVKIPLVVVISGVNIKPYFESEYVTYPEEYENLFTSLFPQSLKNRMARWYLLHNKNLTRNFTSVAKKYHLAPFKHLNDIYLGDHTLVSDDINFLGLRPTQGFPLDNFIGPILPRASEDPQRNKMDPDIEQHLQRPGRSIVVAMGSEYNYRSLIPEIVKTLNATPYNVIIVHKDLNKLSTRANDNILFKKFVPLATLLSKVDLAVIHGGRSTVYTIAYSGKPAIGIPIIVEHQFYLDYLVRAGSGIRISKKELAPEKILSAINTIFDNYPDFFRNAQDLSKRLTTEPGEQKAVHRLLEIYQLYSK